MLSIAQLRYILAVHAHGHFAKAAAEVGVSQPTLSAQIQKAETALGITMFDRHSKPVALTEPGARIIGLVREVLSAHERLLAAAKGGVTETAGEYTLGVIPTLASYVLPWFLKAFAERYPYVELTVHERPTDEILAEIASNRMDGGILATPLGEASLTETVLFYDPFYLYAHPEDELLEGDAVRVADIDSSKLWLLEDGHCFRAQVINLCGLDRRSLLPSVGFAAGSFSTLRHLIDASGGCTLIPETYARTLPKDVRHKQVRAFESGVPVREVSLVHHRESWKTTIHLALGNLITETMPRCFMREPAEGEVLPICVNER